MGIRLYKLQQVHVIDLFQILVKLHNQVPKSHTAPLQCSKDNNRGLLLVDIVVVGIKVLPHN
jgi:hypothetical protein